jgi:ribonuclease HI
VALDATTVLTLQALEESMWRSETRFDGTYMNAVLHPDFTEVGRSGRVFTRDEVLGMPPVDIAVEIPRATFSATEVSPGVALVSYETVPRESLHGAAHRGSVWVLDGSRWLLRYHQGTPAAI